MQQITFCLPVARQMHSLNFTIQHNTAAFSEVSPAEKPISTERATSDPAPQHSILFSLHFNCLRGEEKVNLYKIFFSPHDDKCELRIKQARKARRCDSYLQI